MFIFLYDQILLVALINDNSPYGNTLKTLLPSSFVEFLEITLRGIVVRSNRRYKKRFHWKFGKYMGCLVVS